MIVVALGQKRYGKTERLKRLVRERIVADPHLPVFIHDVRGWSGDVIGALAHPDARYRNAAELRRRNPGRLRHQVSLLYRCPAEELFQIGCWYVDQRRPAILVCDELDKLAPVLDQRKSYAYRVLHYGSFANVDIYGSARVPQTIDKAWISQSDVLIIFRLTTFQVLRQIEGMGTPEAAAAAALAPTLPRFHYVQLEP